MKATTAMLISRIEYSLKPLDRKEDNYEILTPIGTLRTLIETIRELEHEAKHKHAKPSYSDIGKPRYYHAE